jgi:flagellar biosynthesis protein FlhF
MTSKGGLLIKTYYVNSVEEAMMQAERELGPEALLLNTRRVMEAGKPSGYEVVVGIDDAAPATGESSAATSEKRLLEAVPMACAATWPQAPIHVSAESLADELKKLRRQMDEIQELLLRSSQSRVLAELPVPELAEIYSNLLSAQVDPVLGKAIVNRLEAALTNVSFFLSASNGGLSAGHNGSGGSKPVMPAGDRLEKLLCAVFERSVRISPTLGVVSGKMKPATILVGPTGGGKTTTAAKLAAAASSSMPVRLLSLDRSRPGSAAQLQALIANPGIAFSALPTLTQLDEVIAEAQKNHCVLVDTAGHSAADWQAAEDLAAALAKCPELDVQLVVPAHINAGDFRRVIERYSIFCPAKLLVTKTDEAESLGTAVSEAARAELALSFMTNGPVVPRDIRAISSSDLAVMGLRRGDSMGRRAA